MKTPKYKCPYCDAELGKFPSRKTKCKSCGKFHYAKKYPNESKNRIVTETEKNKIDKQWDEQYFLNKWSFHFITFGFTENYTKKYISSFKIKRDGVWSLFQKALAVALENNKLHEASGLYYSMAIFIDEERKNPIEFLKESSKLRLLNFKNQGAKKVRIIGAKGCSSCEKQGDKVYSIDEALNEMPLPNKRCSHHLNPDNKNHSFCRCTFIPAI